MHVKEELKRQRKRMGERLIGREEERGRFSFSSLFLTCLLFKRGYRSLLSSFSSFISLFASFLVECVKKKGLEACWLKKDHQERFLRQVLLLSSSFLSFSFSVW